MEGTDSAFFYTARTFGVNRIIISLTEQTHLDWRGRVAYIAAKIEQRKTELYAMDLLWMLVKTKYEITFPSPSEMELNPKKADRRSSKEIMASLTERLKGG